MSSLKAYNDVTRLADNQNEINSFKSKFGGKILLVESSQKDGDKGCLCIVSVPGTTEYSEAICIGAQLKRGDRVMATVVNGQIMLSPSTSETKTTSNPSTTTGGWIYRWNEGSM
jgi:hypothetical protein